MHSYNYQSLFCDRSFKVRCSVWQSRLLSVKLPPGKTVRSFCSDTHRKFRKCNFLSYPVRMGSIEPVVCSQGADSRFLGRVGAVQWSGLLCPWVGGGNPGHRLHGWDTSAAKVRSLCSGCFEELLSLWANSSFSANLPETRSLRS